MNHRNTEIFTSFVLILKGISHIEATACRESISSFPLNFPQELNPFVYVRNNPVNKIDPKGTLLIPPPITIINPPSYGRYCGLGNLGGKPIDCIDRACKEHDECYEQNNIIIYPPIPPISKERLKCDRDLCKNLDNCDIPLCDIKRQVVRLLIKKFFYCDYIQ